MSDTWTDASGATIEGATDGDDIYRGGTTDPGFLFVNAGPGNDTLFGGAGNRILAGDVGDDLLVGSGDGEELSGGDGNDTLIAGGGPTQLTGGSGDDVIMGGSGPDTLYLSGSPWEYSWTALSDGSWQVSGGINDEGTDTIDANVEKVYFAGNGTEADLPCFLEGTRIMTRAGEVPVEQLRAGDLVLALGPRSPRYAPIRWVGHRRIDLARHADPDAVRPIRVRAGALGPGSPARDLRVSPEHALYLDGALVPARLLADGDAIAPDPHPRRFRYFHVELDDHAILLADGAAAESYRDDGNRMDFDNGGLLVALHPRFAPAAGRIPPCAPLLTEGVRLDAIRSRLAARLDAQAGSLRRMRVPISAKPMRR